MQTTINTDMAFGIPGEHAETTPYYADSHVAGGTVSFGTLGGYDTNGNIVTFASGTTLAGLVVSMHEHTADVYPSATPTKTVPAGTTVAVAKSGTWYVAVPEGETWTTNAKLYINNYAFTTTNPGSGTAVGEVLKVVDGLAAIRFQL